ncbi:hypothetical protein J2X48_002878 [Bosea sp. BE271]|uniref:hypothetical protein n=1 Tax=Bosea TaxID=85413 RepID=UPI0027415F92|nr:MULTISPECIES: hypothetical protein [Bosea]MDR6828964.1 hypothetical protein [Bosea robiniae]MDR6895622.1 hypothetical protein [Bosea sp. BE109]MDR7139017.1 hypothetical protein [Bosea sp. BE168]MDR7175944.1 hypothetical protein [Bosea sp. BE271]
MTNAIHQITSPNSLGSAAAKPKVADRLRQHSVRLYSADGHPLFQYSDKAKTPFDAVEQARAKYDDVLEAIFRARSLTRADVLPKLRAATSEILPGRSANGWRVTSRASSGAANHPRAQHARLGPARVTEIMQSLAMTDRNCIMALQRDYSVSLAMWLSPVGHDRLIEVDSAWLVNTGSDEIWIPHANTVVRDMVRLVILRALSPYHESPGPKQRPFGGVTVTIYRPGSTLLAHAYGQKPAPSDVLLRWLEGEGMADAAKRYREAF